MAKSEENKITRREAVKRMGLMARLFFIAVALTLFACRTAHSDMKTAITRQLQDFPQTRLQDIYKSFYQSYFGAEHLITDTTSVRAYLQREIAEAAADSIANPYYEPTGANGAYVRVYLRCITENLISEQQLFDAFLRSAQPQQRMEDWHRLWQDEIVPAARKAGLGFSDEELAELTAASRRNGAVRHSDDYRNAYHPHYRIVERSIFETEIKPYLH